MILDCRTKWGRILIFHEVVSHTHLDSSVMKNESPHQNGTEGFLTLPHLLTILNNYQTLLAIFWFQKSNICLFLQAVLLLSKLPSEIVGKSIDEERIYDAVNVILSLQVTVVNTLLYFYLFFLGITKLSLRKKMKTKFQSIKKERPLLK